MTASKPGRLHIVCAHIPEADPRIVWTAQAARQDGWNTTVVGWARQSKQSETKARAGSDAHAQRIVFTETSPTVRLREYLNFAFQAAGPLSKASIILGGAAGGGVWALWTLALLPWRLLDYFAVRLGIAARTTARVEALVRRIRNRAFIRLDMALDQRISDAINGLLGYRWYLFTHGGHFARSYIRWLDSNPDQIPEVIHANDPDGLIAGAWAKRRFGVRLIYDAHEYGPEAYVIHPRPRAVFHWLERTLMRSVDSAVTVSPPIAERFEARYRGQPAFKVVPNAPPKSEGPIGAPAAIQNQLDAAAQGRLKILYQGGFAPNRGIEQVIDAWKHVDPDRCALFIRGPENDFRGHLIDHARKSGLLDQSVFFLPSIREEDLIPAARAADIGIIPYLSHIENHNGACPNKLGQYMQAGLAVLSAPLPFVRSILEEAQCGECYDDRDPADLARRVMRFADDREMLERMQASAVRFAMNTYNFDAYFPVLKGLYAGARGNQAGHAAIWGGH